MFTGLIEETGQVLWIRATEQGTQLQIAAPGMSRSAHTGESIAVNGCCLTVSAHRREYLTFDLLGETVARTNLGGLRRENVVNLERALAAEARLGGHFVQGHVDCAAAIIGFDETPQGFRLEIALPQEYARYIAEKGSVAVNGISLTVAQVNPASFVCWIIPHTRNVTNLKHAKAGDLLNLEFDILAKYVERLLRCSGGL
ncbi:MAG: riboflavin synthase [Verrucomicrobia bacterium]|nr:riboflavin synthase [Verrucomicrobiota bacterium]